MSDGIRRRDKASDVFQQTNFLFARKGTFAEAFPTIEHFRADVERSDRDGRRHPEVYTESNVREMVDCSHPLCYGGGFRLVALIRAMVAEQQTDREFFEPCCGYHGSPKGRRNYGSCGESFRVKIHIDYRHQDVVSRQRSTS